MAMTREEVAQLLYGAGFRDDDLVSMVAIAGRESSYNPEAHRTNRDPSQMVGDFGLFQINYINDTPQFRAAIGMTDRAQLLDPEMNARAAFHLYQQSGLKPWTAAEGGWTADGDPLYGTDVAAAREAVERAAASGLLGQDFQGTQAFAAAEPDGPGPSQLDVFVEAALAQQGDTYVFDAQADGIADPEKFDCSELVEWAAEEAGIENIGEASFIQYNHMKQADTLISVDEALHTRGAILFRFPGGEPTADQSQRKQGYHVAISLGDGTTIEAMSPKHGVGVFDGAADREWTHAALLPGVDYASDPEPLTSPADPVESPPDPLDLAAMNANSVDTDIDMLPDHFEVRYGLNPFEADTDGDGITDGYELIVLGTDAGLADTDFDAIADGLELSLGLNPLVADNPDIDAPLEAPDDLLLDTDGDGLTDWGEELAGTNPDDPDSDDDLVLDGDELMLGTDPLTADS